jgi:hypothetical protein
MESFLILSLPSVLPFPAVLIIVDSREMQSGNVDFKFRIKSVSFQLLASHYVPTKEMKQKLVS